VVTVARNGSLVIAVDGQTLLISSASSVGDGIIIEPPIIIDRFDPSTYAAIGGALAGILILAVLITVVLIVIAYFYRR